MTCKRLPLTPPDMRVLAIDPGYERIGLAVVEKQNGKELLLHSECYVTTKTLPFSERLQAIGGQVEALIAKHHPTCMALEKLYFGNNHKTAMMVSEVRGALIYIAQKAGIALFEYTPLEVKTAVTGYGKSSKQEVAKMVGKLVTLQERSRLDDEYDAIGIGITCLAHERG